MHYMALDSHYTDTIQQCNFHYLYSDLQRTSELRFTSTIQSCNALLQPLLPLLRRPARADIVVYHAIEYHCRRDMHALKAILLRLQLHKIRDPVARIEPSVLIRLITDLQQPIHLLLVDTHTSRNLRQPLVRVVPRLIHNAGIEKVLLLLKQLLAEVVELLGLDLEHSEARFMDEGRGRVPGLDLLAEDGYDAVRVLL